MKLRTLSEITNNQEWIGLGIAGNQAEHLDQAGEAEDFKNVIALENAPKGIFPWFIPSSDSFIATNPISSDTLKINDNDPLQPEPEIALVVKFAYNENSEANSKLLAGLSVLGFSAFNDCSRRISAPKISLKKNWGPASQGLADAFIPISDFSTVGGTIENYNLTCYLERDGELRQYGKNTAVSDYCYLNDTLVNWIVNQINTQTDNGPLESISGLLANTKPEYGVIGIGATCYTSFGNSEDRFLKEGDSVIVTTYDTNKLTTADIEASLQSASPMVNTTDCIILRQSAER